MQIFTNISPDIVAPLDEYRRWVMSPSVSASLEASLSRKANPHVEGGRAEEPCSDSYLMGIDHEKHIGYPLHMHGIDLNYKVVARNSQRVDPSLLSEIRVRDNELDDNLQTFLGAKFCALKAYYPSQGHIGWHNNWNAPGYNIIFTYSGSGDGYWRHVEPGADGLKPNLEKIVHVPDAPGWHCKVGYFGSKKESDRVLWHCAYTNEPRLTVSYVIYDQGIWENMVREIRGA
ncbi:MAG: hypothetical protein EOP11_14260 [Proteobacteria bacterium]|nr:MAG: hypothetical protein EOP11_14260 [Pseudomonadota bacterium]